LVFSNALLLLPFSMSRSTRQEWKSLRESSHLGPISKGPFDRHRCRRQEGSNGGASHGSTPPEMQEAPALGRAQWMNAREATWGFIPRLARSVFPAYSRLPVVPPRNSSLVFLKRSLAGSLATGFWHLHYANIFAPGFPAHFLFGPQSPGESWNRRWGISNRLQTLHCLTKDNWPFFFVNLRVKNLWWPPPRQVGITRLAEHVDSCTHASSVASCS